MNASHTLSYCKDITKSECDAVLIIGKYCPAEWNSIIDEQCKLDKAFDKEVTVFRANKTLNNLPIIHAPIGSLTDYHDVRVYHVAAGKAVNRAICAGYQKLLLVVPNSERFKNAELCSVLGALHELYVPIQLREDLPERAKRIESLTLYMDRSLIVDTITEAKRIESGRHIARDIGGGDPERMSPPNVELYIRSNFDGLKINVINDVEVLRKEYPLFAAVDRAAQSVKRHQGRIIYLEYLPPQPATKTLLLVGKGVTYDTGGADIKAGGIMAGMSRDKCGAAAVAGFMKVVQEQKPKSIHVIAALCMVRNSVGEECYVADEIITSRSGVRVRVGNTDAEGRMCMADALCHMKELAVKLPNPHLFTIATLTGHACLSAGEGYSIIMDNSVARSLNHANKLSEIGEQFGEPFEISTLRQDDFDFNSAQVIGEDIVQCNNAASSRTPRGHQVPAAFMNVVSGLDKYGLKANNSLPYTHLDIAASAGEYPKIPTGAPILALAKLHICEN